jgi:hypothetical protein
MDLNKALRELYEEKVRLDRAIARAESRLAALSKPQQRSKRGRKSMSPEERLQVSARMTAYWAARRESAKQQGEQKKRKNGKSDLVGNGVNT